MNNWIAVEDELPTENTNVLAVDGWCICIAWRVGMQWYCNSMPNANISYWMPLPELPD